jgi:hypothetical protein
MGRRRQGNNTLQKKKNSLEDLVGNEQKEYSVPDPKNTMIMSSATPTKKISQRGALGRHH